MQNFVNNLERPNTLKQRAILALRNQRRNKIGDLITLKLTSYLDRPFDRAVDRETQVGTGVDGANSINNQLLN